MRREKYFRACVRHGAGIIYQSNDRIDYCDIGDITTFNKWQLVLRGTEVVIHAAAAARPRVLTDPLQLETLTRINVDATAELAREAVRANVKRFVFISTVGVYGSSSLIPLAETSIRSPQSDYARTKYEAENALRDISAGTGMEVVIIRAPMVYGKGAPGTFEQLLGLVMRGMPLPFGGVNNMRSFIGIDNLVDFIFLCSDVNQSGAANQDFLVSDDEDVSTPEFFRRVAHASGKVPRLYNLNVSVLEGLLRIIGRERMIDQLLKNFQLDITKAKAKLNWMPKFTMNEQLVGISK